MVTFFLVVSRIRAFALAALATVTALSFVTVALDPAQLDSALGMLMFVQMFLASSGFTACARRGHFDPRLVMGSSRTGALVTHWCVSILPGAIAWAAVAGCGYAWSSPAAWSALTGSRLAAFAIVSIVAWVVGLPLPRGAGGAVWMGLLIALLLRRVDLLAPVAAHHSMLADLRTAGALIVCPFLLLSEHTVAGTSALSAALAAVAALLLTAVKLGSRLDVVLVERS